MAAAALGERNARCRATGGGLSGRGSERGKVCSRSYRRLKAGESRPEAASSLLPQRSSSRLYLSPVIGIGFDPIQSPRRFIGSWRCVLTNYEPEGGE